MNYYKHTQKNKNMKKVLFISMIALVMLSSCSAIRETLCPSNDPQFFYKQAGAKPFYHRR